MGMKEAVKKSRKRVDNRKVKGEEFTWQVMKREILTILEGVDSEKEMNIFLRSMTKAGLSTLL